MALSIEGFAIVSSDGMLAGADGLMPQCLKFDPDQKFLNKALDGAALLIHGRKSHEDQPNSDNRRRLLLTRAVGAFSTTPVSPNCWLWNPEATPFADVCKALDINGGVVAVLGGTAAYDLFLPFYAKFHLCRAGLVALSGGVPVFSAVRPGVSPDDALRKHGLALVDEFFHDRARELKHLTWVRPAA